MSDTPFGFIPHRLEQKFVGALRPLSRALAKARISPDILTLVGLVFGLIAGIFLAVGRFHWALLFGFLMGFCDIIDGQVAGLNGNTGRFGAVLDSAIDRYSEFLIFCGLGIYYYRMGEPFWIMVIALAIAGSFMVSYVKARGEGMDMECKVGLAQRSERLLIIALGVLCRGFVLKAALVILAGLSHYTAVQRLLNLRQQDAINKVERPLE